MSAEHHSRSRASRYGANDRLMGHVFERHLLAELVRAGFAVAEHSWRLDSCLAFAVGLESHTVGRTLMADETVLRSPTAALGYAGPKLRHRAQAS